MTKEAYEIHMLHEQNLSSIVNLLRGILHAMMLHWGMTFDENCDIVFKP